MKNLIIKKWVEPYRLLETVKEYCELTDLTFDGMNIIVQKNKMFLALETDENNFALYMKNVNKFYVFSPKNEFDLISTLVDVFDFSSDDYDYSDDNMKPYCNKESMVLYIQFDKEQSLLHIVL